jgi:hypothetical protein
MGSIKSGKDLMSGGIIWPSYTNNPTLNWSMGLERVTVAEAQARGIDVTGLEREPYLILVVDDKHPHGAPQVFTGQEIAALLLAVHDGEYDHLVDPAHFDEVRAHPRAA